MFDFYYAEIKADKVKEKVNKERPTRTTIDKKTWEVGRITEKAVSAIKSATLRKGGAKDTVMIVVIDGKDLHLFTPNVENRLLALFRGMYNDIVLLEISSPAEEEQRKRDILLIKAQREHRKCEKEHLKSLNSAKKCNSDTLI